MLPTKAFVKGREILGPSNGGHEKACQRDVLYKALTSDQAAPSTSTISVPVFGWTRLDNGKCALVNAGNPARGGR